MFLCQVLVLLLPCCHAFPQGLQEGKTKPNSTKPLSEKEDRSWSSEG